MIKEFPPADIIWISTQDWNDVWTRKQRFARLFARAGHRVLYVEGQLHWAGFVSRKEYRDSNRIFRFMHEPRLIEPNLYVATPPIVIPGQMASKLVNRINKLMLGAFVRSLMDRMSIIDPIVWVYPPDSADLVDRVASRLVIFDCVDDWSQFRGLVSPNVVQSYMNRMFRRADICFVTHENLYDMAAAAGSDAYLVPNGVEPDHFAQAQSPDICLPKDVVELPRPVVGFIGSVQDWLDLELLGYLATERPEWSFVFVGPVALRLKLDGSYLRLLDLPNVHFLGQRRYDVLPNYLASFDVCINPFLVDSLSASVDPLKVYEYLAAGKPVVSVDMPAMKRLEELVNIATDSKGFLHELEVILASDSNEEMISKRISAIREHSWRRRFDQIQAALNNAMEKG